MFFLRHHETTSRAFIGKPGTAVLDLKVSQFYNWSTRYKLQSGDARNCETDRRRYSVIISRPSTVLTGRRGTTRSRVQATLGIYPTGV